MDDYFQIIFYLIIIFVFLNSLFRKKDKGETPKRTADSSPPQKRNTYSPAELKRQKEDEYDILKEIEGLFKEDKTYPSQDRRTESDAELAEMRRIPEEEHTEDKEWHEPVAAEHELEKSWHTITQYKRTAAVDASVEEEAKRFERMLAEREIESAFPLSELRKKLFSPETIKEYILVSEIIGKPIYLRR